MGFWKTNKKEVDIMKKVINFLEEEGYNISSVDFDPSYFSTIRLNIQFTKK